MNYDCFTPKKIENYNFGCYGREVSKFKRGKGYKTVVFTLKGSKSRKH